MNTELIAKAIVYAVRQATLINQYSMTWDAIEVNTANILAGCSVPADGKMNTTEAVVNSINAKLQRGIGYTAREEHLQGVVSRQIQSLRRIKGERDAQNERANVAERERDKALEELKDFAQLRNSMLPHPYHSRVVELEARNVELRLQLEAETERGNRLEMERDHDRYRKGAQFYDYARHKG